MATLLQVQNIKKHYGTTPIFDGADFVVSDRQKIGVIGRNGAGKSTLLRIMTGEEQTDNGEITRPSALRLGYLEQHESFLEGETVMAYLIRKSEQPSWQCAKVASRFGLTQNLLEEQASTLSGGFQMRVKLTGMLLKDPNLILMDEPTNFLDLSTQLMLENFLRSYRGAFLVVSHDREFLKRTCEQTLEVDHGKLTLYPLNIDAYLEAKTTEREVAENYNRNVERERKHLQEFVDRFRYKASKASQAQSKIKQIARLNKIEITHALRAARINIPVGKIKKGLALRTDELAIGYSASLVASNITLDIERGKRVAILGDNGQGKSTLLKTLAGNIPALSGEFKWGPDLKIAAYGQHVLKMLNPKDTVIQHLQRMADADLKQEDILRMAGDFLFRDDDLDKQTLVLSGGERARLCLAGLLLTKSQVYLFDEPTNHLDFETVEAVAQALAEYPGTILFVSHNRTFVNQIANMILEVKGGQVRRYAGTYEEYVADLRALYGDEEKTEIEPAPIIEPEVAEETDKDRLKAARSSIRKIEKEMGKLQEERDYILHEMALNPTRISPAQTKRLHEVDALIQIEEERWFDHQRLIEWLGRDES